MQQATTQVKDRQAQGNAACKACLPRLLLSASVHIIRRSFTAAASEGTVLSLKHPRLIAFSPKQASERKRKEKNTDGVNHCWHELGKDVLCPAPPNECKFTQHPPSESSEGKAFQWKLGWEVNACTVQGVLLGCYLGFAFNIESGLHDHLFPEQGVKEILGRALDSGLCEDQNVGLS